MALIFLSHKNGKHAMKNDENVTLSSGCGQL